MSCNVKEIKIPQCALTVFIPTGIDTNYGDLFNLVITDKFGNKYTDVAEFNEDGYLVLDLTNEIYPKDLFTQYAGSFILEIQDSNDCSVVMFTICDTNKDATPQNKYDSYQFSFYKESNLQETFTVCCN